MTPDDMFLSIIMIIALLFFGCLFSRYTPQLVMEGEE
jgi:hypothetical protein